MPPLLSGASSYPIPLCFLVFSQHDVQRKDLESCYSADSWALPQKFWLSPRGAQQPACTTGKPVVAPPAPPHSWITHLCYHLFLSGGDLLLDQWNRQRWQNLIPDCLCYNVQLNWLWLLVTLWMSDAHNVCPPSSYRLMSMVPSRESIHLIFGLVFLLHSVFLSIIVFSKEPCVLMMCPK